MKQRTRRALSRSNAQLLSLLQEQQELVSIQFMFSHDYDYGFTYYEFTPEVLGIRRVGDFLRGYERSVLGIPFTEACYLYLLPRSGVGVQKLSGMVNRLQGRYAEEGEVHVFASRNHRQVKIYHISGGIDMVHHYELPGGTFDLPRGLKCEAFQKVTWMEFTALLKPLKGTVRGRKRGCPKACK